MIRALLALAALSYTSISQAKASDSCPSRLDQPEAFSKEQEATIHDLNSFTDSLMLRDFEPISKFSKQVNQLPPHKRSFCQRSVEEIRRAMLDPNSGYHLAFGNPNGKFNTGVCWAHSLFQRSAAYLANFQPDAPKPTAKQAIQIIKQIRARQVVDIPGFANLKDFSKAYQIEISSELSSWSTDMALNGTAWSRVTDDSGTASPEQIKAKAEQIYDRFLQDGNIVFLRTKADQSKIYESHSWLLLDITPFRDALFTGDRNAEGLSGYANLWNFELAKSYRDKILKQGKTPLVKMIDPEGCVLTVIDPTHPDGIVKLIFWNKYGKIKFMHEVFRTANTRFLLTFKKEQ